MKVRLGLRGGEGPPEGKTCEDCGMFCTLEECSALGDCEFEDLPFPAPNTCKSKEVPPQQMTQTFEVYDQNVFNSTKEKQPIVEAKLTTYESGGDKIGDCYTNSQGKCDVSLLVNNKYTANVSALNYQDKGPLDIQPKSMAEPPYVVFLDQEVSTECTDSDAFFPHFTEGNNYYTKGYAKDREGTKHDKCDNNDIIEAVCTDGRASYNSYTCENGCTGNVCNRQAVFNVVGQSNAGEVPLSGVNVNVSNGDMDWTCPTDESGECVLSLPNDDTFQAIVTPEGYREFMRRFDLPALCRLLGLRQGLLDR
jgi:hypothetical protein